MPPATHPITTGRHAAVQALVHAADRFPDLPPSTLDLDALAGPDAALAVAIHRTVLQRWLTLEHLLDPLMSKPCHRLEPAMRAVLLAGAAQLLFMQRLPAYAVVDEAVALARRLVRPGAAGLANAVLRRFSRLVAGHEPDVPWQPAPDRLPLDAGSVLLKQPLLPDVAQYEAHLAVATSHPELVVRRWIEQFGPEATRQLCWHSTLTPPTIVAVEAGFDPNPLSLGGSPGAGQGEGVDAGGAHSSRQLCGYEDRLTQPSPPEGERASEPWQAHAQAGFVVWRGTREELLQFLGAHPHRRVQDPAAARAVAGCRDLSPGTVLDYCAGRGTKTVQLVTQFPAARVLACDPHADRLMSLRAAAERYEQVRVLTLGAAQQQHVDLLVLDVPCSNTAVLARRPEARYRLARRASIDQVVGLQRQIIEAALPTLEPGGHLLYSTCSIEPAENENQVQRLIKRQGLQLMRESTQMPAGQGASYHDGGYHALLRRP